MEDIRVTSWLELLEVLHQNSWNAELRRFRSPYVFRGQGRAARLTTSLQRLSGETRDLERYLVRAFRKYAQANVQTENVLWYWLALGQHHGVPTRLLDWSYSPLVALHFATAEERDYDKDGVIWMLDMATTNAALPGPLSHLLQHEGSSVFTTDMLATFSPREGSQGLSFDADIQWLERMERESGHPFLMFLEPPSLDQRIVQQSALFSLLSNPVDDLETWLGQYDGAARRVHLPAELKWEVRDRLDQANVTERTLFPDLGGLGQWLRRYYRRRGDEMPEQEEDRTPEDERNRHR